jgi:signal transduction histidine kinase
MSGRLPDDTIREAELSPDRLRVLTQLPSLLNSSLDSREIISRSLDKVAQCLQAEAATVFVLSQNSSELSFWALRGGSKELEGMRMPAGKGIVGWVIEHQQPLFVPDVRQDPRFFSAIEREANFVTRDMLCVPLLVRGRVRLGALQVLNRKLPGSFDATDLHFLEQFGMQLAMAIDNAQMFEQLTVSNRQLQVLDQRRSEMITLIAHEFRTPLNVILSSADMISSGGLQDQALAERFLATLQRGVHRVDRLLKDIQELSLLSSASFEVHAKPVAVAELFELLQRRFAGALAQRKLRLELEAKDCDLAVLADPVLLLIVLRNLISNAIRFTPDGGNIQLRARAAAELVELCVSDTGIGIAADQIPMIFEKFYEVVSVNNHSSGEHEFRSSGLGLGLSTVRTILRAHGRDVSVESVVGQGSSFSFYLPLAELQCKA